MSEKRFTIKPQDDYWAVVDNYNDDKVCIINGIHTKIEAIWLCDFMNEQQAEIDDLNQENEQLKEELQRFKKYVFSEDNILCYKCEHCIKKDIYVVDCEMKGKVDVHGLCSLFRRLKV